MRAMFAGFLGIVIIGFVASFALDAIGYSAQSNASGDSVRLD